MGTKGKKQLNTQEKHKEDMNTSELPYWGISFLSLTVGSITQAYIENKYEKLTTFVVLLCIASIFVVIPILQKKYFEKWNIIFFDWLRQHKKFYEFIGYTCFVIWIILLVYYSHLTLNKNGMI